MEEWIQLPSSCVLTTILSSLTVGDARHGGTGGTCPVVSSVCSSYRSDPLGGTSLAARLYHEGLRPNLPKPLRSYKMARSQVWIKAEPMVKREGRAHGEARRRSPLAKQACSFTRARPEKAIRHFHGPGQRGC